MASTPNCFRGREADHSSWRLMTRLYVRRTEQKGTKSTRKWEPIGWICDADGKSSWYGKGCGAILLDSGVRITPKDEPAPATQPEDE